MFGHRTPMRKNDQGQAPRTPPEISPTQVPNVRKSVGEWESGKKDISERSPLKSAPETSKTKRAIVLSLDHKTYTRKTSAEATSPSTTASYKDKTTEARANLQKAKLHLNSARNLKTEIKEAVLQAVERLYQIVKESEADAKAKTKETGKRKENDATKSGEAQPACKDGSLLITRLEEHSKLLLENNQRMEELKATMEKNNEERATYSTVAASKPLHPHAERVALHSIVVSSEDDTESGEQVLDKVREAVDAKEGWVRVERVRKAKDRKIIMSCRTKDERAQIKERLEKSGKRLVCEEVQNKDPLLILKDVLNKNNDEDIEKALKNQNRHVFSGLEPKDLRMTVKYRRKARNPLTGHIVLSVSPALWKRAIEAGALHIDLQRIKVEDQSPLVQCTRCLGYGHGKRYCKEAVDLCSHCGGPHLRADCNLLAISPSCRNCTLAKQEHTEHNAFSQTCPKKKLATDELMIEAGKRGIALALIQEPYVGATARMKDYRGARIFQNTGEGTVKAAIVVFDNNIDIIQYPELTTNNIIVVGARTGAWRITLVSFYLDKDQPIGPDLEHLRRVGEMTDYKWLVIGGDANAKNTWWGAQKTDKRGEEMLGVLDSMEMQILNYGVIPTFDTIRGGKRYSSHVDITACTTDLLDRVDDWRVDEGLTSSDHNGIAFNINIQKSKGISISRTTRQYNTRKANWTEFHVKLSQLKQEQQVTLEMLCNINETKQLEKFITKFTNIVTTTCLHSIPKKKNSQKLTIPWWSDHLEQLKREVVTRKNRIKRAAPIRRARVVDEYLQKKEEYEKEAVRAQIKGWKEFCERQDGESVWDGVYRVIGRTKKREEDLPLERNGQILDAKGSVRILAETFYPNDNRQDDNAEHSKIRATAEEINMKEDIIDTPFTKTELTMATKSFNPKKAPGSDGFTADICAKVIENDPDLFLKIVNKCLELTYFPNIWKEATVVVLKKPGKDNYRTPKSYRPIGLLPVFGKIFEKMLMTRIKYHLIPRMSTRQYGFMPQRSTEDALYALMQYIRTNLNQKKVITMVSLDIEGAFDSAWWPAIRVRLAEDKCPSNLRKVIDSYLKDRKVNVRYAGEQFSRKTDKGCVQGSIGGPILWNLLLDPLLRELEAKGEMCQAFADDVVLCFDGDTAQEIETRANAVLERVREWGVANKLKFAPQKTNAMVITRKLKCDTPRLSMGGTNVGVTNEIKLLGVTIDNQLTFNTHVKNMCTKAVAAYKQLTRAAKISWGLHPEVVRIIYTATIEPILLYAASVWAPAVTKVCVKRKLDAMQRGFAQKICKAYRTVSLNSALLLSGILPLDLRVREAASLYEARNGVPQPALADWEVERRTPVTEADHPAERLSLEFHTLVDQEQVDANSHYDIRIFTDGSKIGGRVGASLSLWNSKNEITAVKLSLPSFCTVYQAELLALCEASRVLTKRTERKYAIYCDSRAAIQTVTGPESLHPLAVQTRNNIKTLYQQNKTVTLYWIKAHAGLEGNERADELAKEAALKSKKRYNYDQCPVSFVKRSIRLRSLDEWNSRYKNSNTASITKIFFPDAIAAHKIVRKIEMTGVMTQTMTGHGGFSEYLKRFKCKENSSCICEPDKVETVPHILLDCPVFAPERFNIEQEIECKITTDSIGNIMIGKNRDIFLRYCNQIVNKTKGYVRLLLTKTPRHPSLHHVLGLGGAEAFFQNPAVPTRFRAHLAKREGEELFLPS
ncbi:uncharacterized protein LOC113238652 [Hyposmocoma kahamanoa]|uniref:uncharacterized protein LOC113238652 n=1 Tax=Hyposmocoma kahamanoa TaxID=1477025 RepID=UPI000E6DA12A|nr:uncharacterized protein LOC113238652 [Hyposmocoma kahamanoa]